MRKYGKEKRRVWRKPHLTIDAIAHEVISAVVSLDSFGDNEALPTLLNQLCRKTAQTSAEGACDTKTCHQVLRRKGIKLTILPPSGVSSTLAFRDWNVLVYKVTQPTTRTTLLRCTSRRGIGECQSDEQSQKTRYASDYRVE